jgi:hypothetical protein
LAASNNPEAIMGLVVATQRRLSVTSISPEKLSRNDAFVEVWNTNILTSEPYDGPFPVTLTKSNANTNQRLHGTPIFSWSGYLNDGPHYAVSLWIGPDATPSVEAQADSVFKSLRLPTN